MADANQIIEQEDTSIVARLARVMGQVQRVPKTETHPQFGYKFAGVEAIMEAVNLALAAEKVVLIPQLVFVEREPNPGVPSKLLRTVLYVDYTFRASNGETLGPIHWQGEADEPMAQDKGRAKALTACRKTFLRDFFLITFGDEGAQDTDRGRAHVEAQQQDDDDPLLDASNVALIETEAAAAGLDANAIKLLCVWVSNVTSLGAVRFSKAGKLRKLIERFAADPVAVASGVAGELVERGQGLTQAERDEFLSLANTLAEAGEGAEQKRQQDAAAEPTPVDEAPQEASTPPAEPAANQTPAAVLEATREAVRLAMINAGLVTSAGRPAKKKLDVVLAVAAPGMDVDTLDKPGRNALLSALEYVKAAHQGAGYDGPACGDTGAPYPEALDVTDPETLMEVLGDWRTGYDTTAGEGPADEEEDA